MLPTLDRMVEASPASIVLEDAEVARAGESELQVEEWVEPTARMENLVDSLPQAVCAAPEQSLHAFATLAKARRTGDVTVS